MASPPSSALAGAAVSAVALAGLVNDLATAASLPPETGRAVAATCRTVVRVLGPRVTGRAHVGDIGRRLAGAVRDLARAAEPADVAPLLYDAAELAWIAVPVSASPRLTAEYGYAAVLAAGVATACLGEAFLAEARSGFADREAATRARARIAASVEAVADPVAGALGQEVYGILAAVARECGAHLVQMAATLQPVVRVGAARSFPSTALAWSLYGDPARAVDLVARNACGTPLFMPATFEAVSPGA